MSQVRVWNVTDDPRTKVEPHIRMVLGKVIKPGHSVLVDAERLEEATKVQKEVKAGYLHIGELPPTDYAKLKKPPRATADARIVDAKGKASGEKVVVAQGHGEFPGTAIAADAGTKVEEVLSETKPSETKTVEEAPVEVASEDKPAETPTTETTETEYRGRRRR